MINTHLRKTCFWINDHLFIRTFLSANSQPFDLDDEGSDKEMSTFFQSGRETKG